MRISAVVHRTLALDESPIPVVFMCLFDYDGEENSSRGVDF